jgi:hypothetical protein
MGQWDARDRLREMGATDDELGHVFYIEPETPASKEIVEDLVTTWTFSLVVIDAAAGAYSLQALDDNKRADVETFARIYVHSFWLREVATIVVDHVTKKANSRGAFAIGSERKVGGADVHLGFEIPLPIKRGGRGLYKIVTHKDRFGHLNRPRAADLELRSDPDTHAISWTFRQPEPTTETTAWQPTHLMEKVSRFLEKQADEVTRGRVETGVVGTAKFVRLALDALITDGYVEETAGIRGSRPVRSLKPYREATPSDPVATPSDGVGEDLSMTSSARRPPYGDEPDEVDEDEVERLAKLAQQSLEEL